MKKIKTQYSYAHLRVIALTQKKSQITQYELTKETRIYLI